MSALLCLSGLVGLTGDPARAQDRPSEEVCAYWLQATPEEWAQRLTTVRARWEAIEVSVTDMANWRAQHANGGSDHELTTPDARIWVVLKAERYNARHGHLSDKEAFFLGRMFARVYARDVSFDQAGTLADPNQSLRRQLDKLQANVTRYEMVHEGMIRVYHRCVSPGDRPAARRLADRAQAMWDADLAMR